jgi:hypothetical protein
VNSTRHSGSGLMASSMQRAHAHSGEALTLGLQRLPVEVEEAPWMRGGSAGVSSARPG